MLAIAVLAGVLGMIIGGLVVYRVSRPDPSYPGNLGGRLGTPAGSVVEGAPRAAPSPVPPAVAGSR